MDLNLKLLNDANSLGVGDHIIKLVVALVGGITTCLVAWGMPAAKADPLMAVLGMLTVVLIGGISHVQGKKLDAQGSIVAAQTQAPAQQTNIGSQVDNTTKPPAAVDPPPPVPQPAPEPSAPIVPQAVVKAPTAPSKPVARIVMITEAQASAMIEAAIAKVTAQHTSTAPQVVTPATAPTQGNLP